jgi:outer membrane protein insertion porin family
VGSGFAVAAVFAAVVLITSIAGWSAPREILVESIAVSGAERTPESAITNTFGIAEGQTHAYEDIRKGLGRVYRMGFFSDVRLRTEESAAGQKLTIDVVERPLIGTITINAGRKIDKGDVREKLELGVGSSLDERLLFRSLKAVRGLYREKGYYIAEVDYEIVPTAEGTVDLVFNIDEGVKVKVGKIRIDGNKALSDKAIRKKMETTEKGWFRRKDYNPTTFEEDMDRIVELYRDEGFREAEVVSNEVRLTDDKKLADLNITIEEGPRLYVREVDVELLCDAEAEKVLSEEGFARGVDLECGDAYSQRAYHQTLENLYSTLGDQGYVYAQIEPVEEIEGDSVSLTLKVVPERAVRVNKIVIEGNETTLEKVIRREMVIRPGDILRRSMIERSHREIFNLGYFEDVQVGSQVANEIGDIDLVFRIKERQTGIGNVGAGYSEEFGLTGFLEFSHNNVGWYGKFPYLGLGKGQSINLRWEFGKLTQIDLSFRDPWFRDRPVLVGFDLYDTRREYDTYTDKRDGFGIVVGRRLPYIDYSRVYWRYRLERREIVPDENKASDLVKSQAGRRTTSSTVITFLRNSVDNPFFPRRGSRTSLTCEWAGGLLGGTTAFQSYILDNSAFLAMPWLDAAVVLKVRTGVVDGLGSDPYIPVYERFRLGGTTTDGVRGYSEREIVPEGNAIDDGGRFMVLGTIEYRIPVIKNRAHLLAFMDAGNTWNSVRAARPGFLRRSAGMGFRIEIPMMGQMGLDLGYGFDREDRYGGPGWETHFQFGTAGY